MNQTVFKFALWAKEVRSRKFFATLEKYCAGNVLDVGGWDFFKMVLKNPKFKFDHWTNLEREGDHLPDIVNEKYVAINGDGEQMSFPSNFFDTVINSLVLEHTFEPLKMVKEIGRVLKPGGHAIFLIPQTGCLHHIPDNYCNFTKFWIKKALDVANLRSIEFRPVGGSWSSTASHFVHFFFQAFNIPDWSSKEYKRNFWFYPLLPFMIIYAAVGVVLCMLFSLGDLSEEPNYHLVVATKDKAN